MNPVSAGNYAAECEVHIRRLVRAFGDSVKEKGNPRDVEAMNFMADQIKNAVKFAIPDGGKILNDGLRGLVGKEFRLPYQLISVEYKISQEDEANNPYRIEDQLYHAPKRLCVASEMSIDDAVRTLNFLDGTRDYFESLMVMNCDMVVMNYVFCEARNLWRPMVAGWVTPSRWECSEDEKVEYLKIDHDWKSEDGGAQVRGMPFPCIRGAFNWAISKYGAEKSATYMMNDIIHETCSVMELCEALSCSNVVHEPIKEVGNPRTRKRFGLPPEYETRVLKIKAPYERGSGSSRSCESEKTDRKMVREHLRRGHIRRYQNGTNIWVNSCVVGAKELGRIEKSYQVKS